MRALTIVLTAVLALAFLGIGSAKLVGHPQMMASADHFGIPRDRYRMIGVPEVAGALGLLAGLAVPALGIAAGIGLALLTGAAVGLHLRHGDPAGEIARAAVFAVASLVVVALIVGT